MNHQSTKPAPVWRRKAARTAVLGFAIGVLTAAGAAGAHAGTAPAPRPAAPGKADFTAQAERAGLSGTKAKALQSRVDGYLAKYHGKQIAANKIAAKGMYITLALPGEKYARTLPAAGSMQAGDVWQDKCLSSDSTLYNGWFCMYKGETFQGDVLSMYTCGDHRIYDWYGNGSWSNNQTQGTVALLRSANWTYQYHTPGAYSSSYSFNWTPVDVVHPC